MRPPWTWRSWTASLAAGLALICTSSAALAAQSLSCPRPGAVYAAHPAAPGRLSYQLRIEALPKSDDDAAFATLWRFQILDSRTRRKLTELRMNYSCSNGPGPCSVSPPSRPGDKGGLASDVVQLARDFAPAAGDRTPYALVLPGFAQDDWSFPRSEQSMPDLTFFTPEHVLPDLRERQVWLLTACVGAKRAP